MTTNSRIAPNPGSLRRTQTALTPLTVLAALTGLLATAPALHAAIFYVGSEPECDTTTINGAVVGAAFTLNEDDEIRLTEDQTNVNRELRNFDPDTIGTITISGNWSSCVDRAARGLPPATRISGNGSDPVFEVVADGAESVVTFDQLEIIGSADGVGIASGRGVTIVGPAEVSFLASRILDFQGGLEIEGGAEVLLDGDTIIAGNVGLPGAGLLCHGSTVRSAANIADNATASSGGGVFLDSGCVFHLLSGAQVRYNQAGWGGGFAIGAGARLEPESSDPIFSAFVFGNVAQNEGGGLYVVNGGYAEIENTWVRDNSAGERGGGVFVDVDSTFFMSRNGPSCIRDQGCSRLSGNSITTAGGNREGTALYVGGGSTAGLFTTHVEGNDAIDDVGTVLVASGATTQLSLEGVALSGNRTESLFDARSGAEVLVAYTSAADNGFDTEGSAAAAGGRAWNGTLEIYSSALWGHGAFDATGGGTIYADCLVAQTTTGITTLDEHTVGIDPLFVDPGATNLRLAAHSVAVDYCDVANYVPLFRDLDDQPRGWDAPTVPDDLGDYDVGAYELFGLLFGDGFESGDPSAWSATTP
ncbi:MAG: hypothetical protein DWQ30_08395 [Acidobacteria bacterium]|nr:MAG: hypothetical protein DWQ30_08395 [Acidobacteriota bacterium]